MSVLECISPVDGRVYQSRPVADDADVASALVRARQSFESWKQVPLSTRIEICRAFAARMTAKREELGEEIAWQMGRPIAYAAKEIDRMCDRALFMCDAAPLALEAIVPDPIDGFERYIWREPLGVVFVVAPWNYPYLTAINTLVAALLAGNAVVLKHSPQTPLCGERLAEAFRAAGLPEGVFQVLHLSSEQTRKVIQSPEIDFLAFTGSVAVGRILQQVAANRFIGVGLELGGKDPAYVRADANLDHAIENVVDGAFFNSGQSCCAVERVYVHENVYDRFVSGAVELAASYRLGDPLSPETTLGPMVRTQAADFVRGQIREAVSSGAKPLASDSASKPGTPYLAPQLLVDVDHSMRIMVEETFGPAVGIMKVSDDEEAIRLMNDSPFGLTGSVWTEDVEAAKRIGDRVETGTWFMNRCDYLDPALAWTGVKDSGRGATLSRIGFEHLTRPKSFHLRVRV